MSAQQGSTATRRFPKGTTLSIDHFDHAAWQAERIKFRVQLDPDDFLFPTPLDAEDAERLEWAWEHALTYPDDLEWKARRHLSREGIKRNTYEARRRLEVEAPGHCTPSRLRARIAFYGGLCWICRRAPGNSIDHVKPLARGGSNWPANLRPACRSCNSRKRDTWPYPLALAGRGGV